MILEAIHRWQFRRGFRAGYDDAKAKRTRALVPDSWHRSGHRLGVACYALGLEPVEAMRLAERGAFTGEK